MKGKISEVFESIQGEGLYVGEKQLFVRFFGCNLSCSFCDTKSDSFFEYDPEELFQELKLYLDQDRYHSVSFTGGEPLLQLDFLKSILKLTRRQGCCNYLETNGTLTEHLREVIDDLDIVAMDIKLPSSTGGFPFWKTQQKFLKVASLKEVFVKMVITRSTETPDLLDALDLIQETDPAIPIVFQPDSMDADEAIEIKIEYYKRLCQERFLTCCAIPQMHKLIGVR